MQDIFRFALPMRNLYNTGKPSDPKADDRMVGVYDSTAVSSTVAFANRIQGDLLPPFQQWVEIEPGPFFPEQFRHEAQLELEDVARKGFALIHASNFDLQVNEFLLELAAGTGAMLVHEDDSRSKPVRFEAVPVATVAFDEAPDGSVDGKFRRYSLPARNVQAYWPDFSYDGAPHELVDKLTKDDHVEDVIEFDECTYFDRDDGVWRYEVIWGRMSHSDSNKAEGNLYRCVERTMTTDPWVITRWIKVAGERQGRGPLHLALPDIRTANAVVALVLQNASFAVSGAFVGADDGVLNPSTVEVVPGAVIAAKRPENLQALTWGGDFNVAELVLADMRGNIRRLLFDERLPPMDASVRSATEIVERIKQLQADIGAPFGRLMSELVQPLWVRLIDIMSKKRLIPRRIEINGLTVQINVTSPLAKQQAMKELEMAMLWIQLLQQLGPEAMLLNVKVEDVGEWLGDKLKVDRRLMRGKQERVQIQRTIGAAAGAQMGGGAVQPQPGQAPAPQPPQPLAMAA